MRIPAQSVGIQIAEEIPSRRTMSLRISQAATNKNAKRMR
jgi:hypothetical protein